MKKDHIRREPYPEVMFKGAVYRPVGTRKMMLAAPNTELGVYGAYQIKTLEDAEEFAAYVHTTINQCFPAENGGASERVWFPATVNADLEKILGMMCFVAAPYARFLRERGQDIPHKAEAEQAAVIHWLLGLYFKHGPKWSAVAMEQVDTHQKEKKDGDSVSRQDRVGGEARTDTQQGRGVQGACDEIPISSGGEQRKDSDEQRGIHTEADDAGSDTQAPCDV